METNQIYGLINDVNAQTIGTENLTILNTEQLVALGDYLFNSGSVDLWTNTLLSRIASTKISYRAYQSKLGIYAVSDITMGLIMQKIKVDMPNAVEDVTTQLQDGQSVDMYIVSKPTAHQKLFAKRTPATFFRTTQRKWLREAFTSESAMGSFLAAVQGEVNNKIELTQENLARLTMANFMALISQTASRVVNLVSEYNSLTGNDVPTGEGALLDEGFCRYALGRMNKIAKYMETMSRLYNDGSVDRHSPKGSQRFVSLIDFRTALETQVQWAAFNERYVATKNGVEVPYWQSAKSPFDIKLRIHEGTEDASDSDDDVDITLTNVVGMIHDVDAFGTYRKEMDVITTPVNARGAYYNTFWHLNDLYFNDVSENGILFTLN
ncbi:MAG: hypothetical protein IIW93_05505 [Bacteroidaceae bacterium]|nr:hypothetical protein [Bacteroidaceae bacterium]